MQWQPSQEPSTMGVVMKIVVTREVPLAGVEAGAGTGTKVVMTVTTTIKMF
jgi:hypothetical protein